MQVNPHSNEVRYTLGLMATQLQATRPQSVRIATLSTEMALAAARYICHEPLAIRVENEAIRAALYDTLAIKSQVVSPGSAPADAALLPFSIEENVRPAGEPIVIAACFNALSYKSLLYPGAAKGTLFSKLKQLDGYRTRPVAGLYSPRFILALGLARLIERWSSAYYFRLEDYAMRRLIDFGPLWRFSYIVVIIGQSTH